MVAVFSLSGFAASFVTPALCIRFANPFPVVIGCAICHLVGFAGLLWMPLTGTTAWGVHRRPRLRHFPNGPDADQSPLQDRCWICRPIGIRPGFWLRDRLRRTFAFGVLHEVTGRWTSSFGFLLLAVIALLIGGYGRASHASKTQREACLGAPLVVEQPFRVVEVVGVAGSGSCGGGVHWVCRW